MKARIEFVARIFGSALAVVYLAQLGLRLDQFQGWHRPEPALAVGAAIALTLALFRVGRFSIRWFAAAHAALAAALFHAGIKWYQVEPVSYMLQDVLFPAAVALFVVTDWKPEPNHTVNLPPGYEFLGRRKFALTAGWKVLVCLGVLVAIPLGTMMFAFAVPAVVIGFALYWILGIVRSRRAEAPAIARRMTLRWKRRTPAQTQSYWTVNKAPFTDKDST